MSRLSEIHERLERYRLTQSNYGDSDYYMLLCPREAQNVAMLLEVAKAVRALLRADHEYALATEAEMSAEAEVAAATDAMRAALEKLEEVSGEQA